MYCKKCGNPIEESKNICTICGGLEAKETDDVSQAAAEGTETKEQADARRAVRHTEFNWNVYDFPKPKKTEDLDLKWTVEEEKAARAAEAAALAGQKHEECESLQAVETESEERPVEAEAAVLAEVPPLEIEENLKEKAEAEAARAQSIKENEKFFTFTKKSEEFQRLLDVEYEKLKQRREGEPYIEPEIDFLHELSESQPDRPDAESELERMIFEGTTSSEDAAPVVDLLRRRTIPVDLDQIQKAVKTVETEPKEEEIPSIELPRKSVEEMLAVCQPEEPFQQEIARQESEAPWQLVEEMPGREAAGAEGAPEPEPQPEPVPASEESPVESDDMAQRFAEMRAARESFLKQLEAEREALRKAEEEAARRGLLYETMTGGRGAEPQSQGQQPEPQCVPPSEMAVNRFFSGANAEIQVTVAVKANGGMPPQETISVIRQEPVIASQPGCGSTASAAQGGQPADGAVKTAAEENPYVRTRVIDAEAVKVIRDEQERESIAEARRRQERENQQSRENGEAAREEPVVRDSQGQKEKISEAFEEPWHENTLNNLFPVGVPAEQEEEDEEEAPSRGRAGKILLAILLVLLVVELAALGIKNFAPESAAAAAVVSAEVKVVEMFNNAKETVFGFFNNESDEDQKPVSDGEQDGETQEKNQDAAQDEQQPEKQPELPPVPDPTPAQDKAALVQSQLGQNKNIKEVSASDELKYVEGKDYGVRDINKSRPISYNIWKTLSDGRTLYYDQAVVGAVIAYDSQWQDYVNNGDKAVLERTKEGSAAYQSAVDYSRVGKEVQSFESLELGEIRVGDNGLYIWAKEQIKKTINGKTETVTYRWIYQLEPVGDDMKIVSFRKF